MGGDMAEDLTAGITSDASPEELQAIIAAQQAELEALRARVGGAMPSRRSLLKGAGVVAGGLAALGAVQATSAGVVRPEVAGAIEGHNIKYGGSMTAFATIKGQKQGSIKGGVVQKGREGQIACHYFQHKVVSPRDAASGLPTGKRSYDTLVLRKEFDQSTPKLTTALVQNETLTEVHLFFYRASISTGTEVLFFTIDLQNASLVSQNWYKPDGLEAAASSGGGSLPQEELEFVFQKIIWTYVDGGIQAQDDWESPVA